MLFSQSAGDRGASWWRLSRAEVRAKFGVRPAPRHRYSPRSAQNYRPTLPSRGDTTS